MGCHFGFSKSQLYDKPPVIIYKERNDSKNPDPKNYTIKKIETIGRFLIIEINYPNCTNFEGNKILVFLDDKIEELMNQKAIDPYFSDSKKYIHPVARFIPNKVGWMLARNLAKTCTWKEQKG